jgi:hypothetical protein
MKLSLTAFLLALAAASTVAVVGCAADSTDANSADTAGDVGVSADALSARAQQFVGSYAWRGPDSGEFVDFQELTLGNDGRYTASVDAQLVSPTVRCVAFPCTLPEAGTWSAVRSDGQVRIKVNPAGGKPSRSYAASIVELSRTLSLSRFGHATTLLSQGSTCANVRCTATTHCEMHFDKGSYAPSCVANAPPPPPAPACAKTGCSGQICADHSMITTCQYEAVYACFQAATCERQADGQCGFTQTPALAACVASH